MGQAAIIALFASTIPAGLALVLWELFCINREPGNQAERVPIAIPHSQPGARRSADE